MGLPGWRVITVVETSVPGLNQTPDRNESALTKAARELSSLKERADEARALLARVQQDAIEAQNGQSSSQGAQLLEANGQLVLATLWAQAAEDALREAARQKDDFIAMVGHELRNPLGPILNAAEVLHRIAGDDKRLDWVHDVLVRQVRHMARLVDDLLDISRITRGTMQLALEPVDVCASLGWALEAAEPLMKRRRHRLESRFPEHPVWVAGDAMRLVQVFENLLTNAAKYSDDNGAISIGLEVEGEMAVIRVRDSGLGISPDMLPRIFELFVQDARSIDRSQGGLGIGLALVRHLVKLHRGAVEAHSEGVGKGSEFVVRLPMLPESRAPNPAVRADPAGGKSRVMIVDDDPDAGESMAVILRLYGYDVERAVDLDSAMRIGRAFRPQVLVMDIAMPGADGYGIVKRLSATPEMGNETVYIGVSGFGQPEDFRRSHAAGFAHHFVKPVDPVELDAVLRRALKAKAYMARPS
jgi:signal transduction histidine kinase/ActR/RegA family two-component response regulator